MPNIPRYKMPSDIYSVRMLINGSFVKYATAGVGITEQDRMDDAEKDARKYASSLGDKDPVIQEVKILGS